ncbi:hypothetical protein [Draconibacterium sediminis]|uniref:hypothetical protein n=1 Tax=Draconibacterium sediminis TaxID=1544798 RepID=UPI0026ECF106|nr:hypothetical protein [Draconibacterium sediminis]
MKQITIILCLLLAGHFSFSQERTEIGITAEGAWFMPYRTEIPYTANDWATKNGFGAGVGVYASHNLLWRVSADIGIIYRYKQMQQHYSVYSQTTEGYSQYPYEPGHSSSENETVKIEGWDKLPMHYVVVPLHLQLLIGKNLFVKGGFETSWLLNYDIVNEKPEFNWVIGFGSQKYKLKWSVNYIRGFKEQGFAQKDIKPDGRFKGSINRNNMLQLKLSYPIGQLKF